MIGGKDMQKWPELLGARDYEANYEQRVKLIDIGVHKRLSLGIGEHKGLSSGCVK